MSARTTLRLMESEDCRNGWAGITRRDGAGTVKEIMDNRKQIYRYKKRLFLIPVCMAAGLCACGNNPEDSVRVISLSEEEQEQTAVYCNSFMTVTDYGVIFPIQSQSGGILEYYDFSSDDTYPFCSNVNCGHKDDSCDAWFDSMVTGPAIYNGRVYLFLYNDDGSWDLLSMDTDGTNRGRVAGLEGKDFSCDSVLLMNVWYGDDAVTFTASCESWDSAASEDFYVLAQLNLPDGRLEILDTMDTSADMLAYEDGVAFLVRGEWDEPQLGEDEFYEQYGSSADYDDYYSEWYQTQYRDVYYLLDVESGETEDLLTVPGSDEPAEWDYDRLPDEGILYGTVGDTIYGVDLRGKTLQTIYRGDSQLSIECAADGNIFFLQLDGDREEMLSNSYLDISSGEVTDLDGRISGGGWIYGSTDRYFIGESGRGFCCITKEDFYSSDFDRISVMKKY